MDIYNEDDNVISSDDYDETDDLLNVAISATAPVQTEPEKTKYKFQKTKPEKKILHKLTLKLKKKSVKWMHLRQKRIEIRKHYLDSIARAKCINKPPMIINDVGGAEFNKSPEPTKKETAVVEEKGMPRKDAKVTEHETIDLDDDTDEYDDEDDYDDDDDSSSNSSKSSNDDMNEINDNDDDDDEDMDEINNDDDDIDDIKHDEDEDGMVIELNKQKLDNRHAETQPVTVEISAVEENKTFEEHKNAVENISNTVVAMAEEPMPEHNHIVSMKQSKPEHKLEEVVEVTEVVPPKVGSSNIEAQMSQREHASLKGNFVEPTAVVRPKMVETFTSMDLSMTEECNMNNNMHDSATMNNTKNSHMEILDVSKDLGIEQSFFFNDELNAMFPNFDKIVNEHVTFPQTAEIIKERIKSIAADVEHINKALEIKERECNQLLYVKHTKEQILARLLRKIKRNEVNTADDGEIEAFAARELGIVPKQTRPKETPPAKRRKLEPRTAQEIIEHGASMSMDEVLRAKVQNQLGANFLDETLRKFGLNTPKQNVKLKSNLKKLYNNHGRHEPADTSLNLTQPPKRSYQSMQRHMEPQQQQQTPVRSSQNLLLNLLNNDNDDSDDASISYNMKNIPHESTLYAQQPTDNWSAERQRSMSQRTIKNFNGTAAEDDEAFEVFVEKRAPPTKTNNFFPILNQSKQSQPNNDETLVVQLDLDDFKHEAPTPEKSHGNKININNFICQYCGIHKAQYVCAECENQWYCSRSCQVKAWDSHCETCE